MSVSPVDLANDALGLLSRDSIRSLDGSTPAAIQMSRFMPRAINEVIGSYDWPECRVIKTLTAAVDVDTRGWSKAFVVPSDAVVVWRVGPARSTTPIPFEIGLSEDIAVDTNYIYCDQPTATVRYGSRRASLSRFAPDIFELMAIRLAIKACMPLTKDPKLFKFLEDRFTVSLSKAKTRVANLEPHIQDTEFTPELIQVRQS